MCKQAVQPAPFIRMPCGGYSSFAWHSSPTTLHLLRRLRGLENRPSIFRPDDGHSPTNHRQVTGRAADRLLVGVRFITLLSGQTGKIALDGRKHLLMNAERIF